MKGMKRQICNVFVQSLNKIKLCCYRRPVFVWQEYSNASWPYSSRYSTVLPSCGRTRNCTWNVSMKHRLHWDILHPKKFTSAHMKSDSQQEIFWGKSVLFFQQDEAELPFAHWFTHSSAICSVCMCVCLCVNCSMIHHPRLSSVAVDNWHWRRQCVGEDDSQMSLCVGKKNPSCQKQQWYPVLPLWIRAWRDAGRGWMCKHYLLARQHWLKIY